MIKIFLTGAMMTAWALLVIFLIDWNVGLRGEVSEFASSISGCVWIVFSGHQRIGVRVQHGEAGQAAIATSVSILSTCAVAELLLRKRCEVACAAVKGSFKRDCC